MNFDNFIKAYYIKFSNFKNLFNLENELFVRKEEISNFIIM